MIDLSLYSLRIPFKVTFKHASSSRSETQSLWVEARDSSGNVGYGESCPREYVTGESIDSAKRFFEAHKKELTAKVSDYQILRKWVNEHREAIDKDPAAWCAIELALLDLFAKQQKVSVEKLIGLPELSDEFRYTAVLGDSDLQTFQQQVAKYHAVGFKDFKVKLSGKLENDRAKLQALSRAQRIRLDANNLWRTADEAIAYLKQLDQTFFAVEEPIQVGDYKGMAEIAKVLDTRIVLDESCTREEQFEQFNTDSGYWIVNVRVSKMGGLLRSLAIVENGGAYKVPIIVGAQVGETSLLTRAALTVAAYAGGGLLAQEGAFGTLLLSADVCQPPLMFGAGGVLSWQAKEPLGFGLAVSNPSSAIERISA